MTPAADTTVDDVVADLSEAVPNATAQDNVIATASSGIDVDPHQIPLPAETDNEMFDVYPPAAIVNKTGRQEESGEAPATESQT